MAKRIERKMSSFGSDSSSAAETVANIEEILTQILVSLPPRSVARFKCVSKLWLSHISKPEFFRHYTLQNSKISAFFSKKIEEESFKFIPLGNHEIPSGFNPFKTLNKSVHDGSKLKIIQSCNGLFLCFYRFRRQQNDDLFLRRKHDSLYVVNPTTNKFLALSSPSVEENEGPFLFVRYGLAFDPWKSPHYKVVCVSNSHFMKHHRVDIYSSETGTWGKRLKVPFFPSPSDEGMHPDGKKRAMDFDMRSREGAVYCNGAVHWIRWSMEASLGFGNEFVRQDTDVLHRFDIGEEQLRLAAVTPPVPLVVKNIALKDSDFGFKWPTEFPRLAHRYFGESGGRLYLIETYKHCNTHFEVMEMERDYSGWFVKYNVDLTLVFAALPRQDWNAFVVLCLSREEETDDLLLHMPGKVISYNLRNKSFKTSVELANTKLFLALDDEEYSCFEDDNYPYMETLACV